jgi:hypothetical protein
MVVWWFGLAFGVLGFYLWQEGEIVIFSERVTASFRGGKVAGK